MVIADRNGDNLLHASLAGKRHKFGLSLDLLYDDCFQHEPFYPLLLLRYGSGVDGRFGVGSSSTRNKPTQSLEPGGFFICSLVDSTARLQRLLYSLHRDEAGIIKRRIACCETGDRCTT
jgi:hypothetical protein